jgi:drug/metabolite transporter (DMT)-like permease
MSVKRLPTLRLDRYTLYGVVAILLWSTTVALARSLTEQVGSLTAASSVYLVSGAFCLTYLFSSTDRIARVRRLPLLYVLGCGALFVLYMLAVYLAIGMATDRQQALEIGLINYLWPALTLVLSLFLLDNRARLSLVPGTVLALFGVFVVLTQGSAISWASFSAHVRGNPIAYSLALTAAVSWALYSNLTRRWAGPESGGAVTLFIPATGMALLLLRLLTTEQGSWHVRTTIEVAFMAAATAIAYALWDIAMRKGNVVLVAAASYFTPLFSMLISFAYLDVAPSSNLWLGCLCIILGSLASWASVSDQASSQ